ncbi:Kelch repeat-containing protein [Chryseobacterium sp. SC28]|uniref:Kelch repeat-containing protein n=1 Tax=Chryseobacterium sp. SC28 TaxID=2268028 RepID=UPI000F64CB23|nr:kelch-like protein [Chryseobacterium sp. SC28]RRQ45230.1 kelch-like protein [Chryseobacterium sp. SC28]
MDKKFSVLVLALASTFFLSNCSNDDNEEELVGNWVRVSDLDGKPRSNASAFVVNGKGYLTGGYDGEYYYNDLWSYDPEANSWTQKADFPGVKRSSAVGFATTSYGYVGTGYDGVNKLNDFYKYDPLANAWSPIENFPGTGRYAAIAFGVGNKGFVGTGYDGSELKDFYKYDESTSTWTNIVSLGGSKRRDGAAFVINGIAYVGFGTNNGSLVSDFWSFDPSAETWMRKGDTSNDDESQNSSSPAAFSAGGLGYVSTGSASGVSKTTWEYNPSTDDWTERTAFQGAARESACAFSFENYGYVLTGNSGSSYFDDIWVFHPTESDNEDD